MIHHRRSGKRALLALTSIGLAATLVAGCGGTTKDNAESGSGSGPNADKVADPDAPIKEGLQIAFLPKEIDNPYENIVDEGGISAVEELKGSGKEVGPSDASASSQVSYINTLVQQNQDAIVIAANDPNAVAPALKEAMDKGIAVVSYDSDAAVDARQVFVNQADSESIGRSQIQMVSEQIGGKGKIAILSATPNATNQNTWIEFMKDELKKPEYSDIELVTTAYGDDDDQKSFQETQALLSSTPDLKAIVSPTTVGIAAAARYISSSPYKGKVVLTGLGTPNQMRQFIKDGTVKEFALWDPEQLGYLAGYAAAALASGQITGKEGEVLKAGELGEREIGKNGEIILGPPTTFNADNIDDFDF
ncbi:rhamnose ABC transporter substrate-binding protein [Prauserella cavernicola]|uniref:Rhamnose ABC transporter substrate-binding protein n=1 Tax=Prauserella cavernicola TaxID=2800127 RepID=A0A934QRQ1_9PSEU|nr:rhamnose ABC transporter substrate-binding protein [Prauserella cavernicola]MBK1784938.1 rhamnose ABC transporter substrate-binding protein [Prauserella cavernicola]